MKTGYSACAMPGIPRLTSDTLHCRQSFMKTCSLIKPDQTFQLQAEAVPVPATGAECHLCVREGFQGMEIEQGPCLANPHT